MTEVYYLQNIRLKGNEHGQLQKNTIYANLVHEDGSLAIAATLKHILKTIRDKKLSVDNVVVSWEPRRGTYCSEVHLTKYPIHKGGKKLMPLPINYDFSEKMTVRCIGAGGSVKTGKEGEYYGHIWVGQRCWAIVLWDVDNEPTLYAAELLLIEKKIWVPLLK